MVEPVTHGDHNEVDISAGQKPPINVDETPVSGSHAGSIQERHRFIYTLLAWGTGTTFLIALLVISLVWSSPTPPQLRVQVSILALGAAGFATVLTGLLNVRLKLAAQLAMGATGALAVLVLFYFYNPAVLLSNDPSGLSGGVVQGGTGDSRRPTVPQVNDATGHTDSDIPSEHPGVDAKTRVGSGQVSEEGDRVAGVARTLGETMPQLPRLPPKVLRSLDDDILAKFDVLKTAAPVSRMFTVFYEPSRSRGYVKLQLIQYGSTAPNTETWIKARSVPSQGELLTPQVYLYTVGKAIQEIVEDAPDNSPRFRFLVSTNDIVAVAASYHDYLVSGEVDARRKMDWTSVTVEDLAARGALVYDFAMASRVAPINFVDAAEYWRPENASSKAVKRHEVRSGDLGLLPLGFVDAFHRIAQYAADQVTSDPFRSAFKTLSKMDFAATEWTVDHQDAQVHSVMYITRQTR